MAERAAPAVRPTPALAAVASEWTKLAAVRSTWVLAGLAIGLGVLASAGVGMIIGATWDDWPADEQVTFDPVTPAFICLLFSGILLTVLGVLAMGSEHGSGMIRLTLTATPRRGRVLAAKAVVVAALSLVVGTVTVLAGFAATQAAFAAYGLETASATDGPTARALVAASLLAPVFPVIGVALATILRSTAGAIAAVLGLIFAPPILGALLPAGRAQDVRDHLPDALTDRLTYGGIDASVQPIDGLLGTMLVAGWVAAFLAAAWLVLERRDA